MNARCTGKSSSLLGSGNPCRSRNARKSSPRANDSKTSFVGQVTTRTIPHGAVHAEPGRAIGADVHAAGSDDLAALARDVLVPSRAADQPREPGAGLEAVDALDELDPLARAGVRHPFHC